MILILSFEFLQEINVNADKERKDSPIDVSYECNFLFDIGIMIHHSKILVRILPWDPWLPRCSKKVVRSCHSSQDVSEKVNR